MPTGSRNRRLLLVERRELASASGLVDLAVDDGLRIGQLHRGSRPGHLGIKSDPARIRAQDHHAGDILTRVTVIEGAVGRDVEGVGEPGTVRGRESGPPAIEPHTLERPEPPTTRLVIQLGRGESPQRLSG